MKLCSEGIYAPLGHFGDGFRIQLKDPEIVSSSSGQTILVSPGETIDIALSASKVSKR